jgi:hypothetical protein
MEWLPLNYSIIKEKIFIMKKLKFLVLFVLVAVILGSCANSQKLILPLSEEALIEDTYTIVWNGSSKAYRYTDGKWAADESYDYIFNVVQKRYKDQWKSVKNMHRLHPNYDGKAGDRNQSMYFEINYQEQAKGFDILLQSSIGDGQGSSDQEYRKQVLDFEAKNVSSFAPYNRIRISQHYQYESGILEEIVLLYKLKHGEEVPFMKMEEKAYFYTKGKLDEIPFVAVNN